MAAHPVAAQFNLRVDYHLFFLAEENERPEIPGFANRMVAVAPGFAAVKTGIAQGDVRLSVEVHKEAPPVEIADWEEAVEVTLEATIGRIQVAAMMDWAPPFPVLTPNGPGDYRVRVHARGRDNAIDLAVTEPVEEYLAQIWPAPPAHQVIYKQSDRYGAQWVLPSGGEDSEEGEDLSASG
ncbi:hypothetical protein HUT06_21485 [Actinomadura sp. NAK00032]|uniref:hypothetical protein n=1 Tax=Actinomadura sp. NAK00032 TaxID=2742128 RepID=UPI001591136B|nr:hypothetical protein [Actinomadura sp. NAK00032]QKW36285.1 hypothetical protein HUT06_21485 [Actinomadura sp. NAK00032]